MSSISTHVLDTSRGKPAAGVRVTLVRLDELREILSEHNGSTDEEGRISSLLGEHELVAGTYRLTFDTAAYYSCHKEVAFYPRIDITFTVEHTDEHFHVPLLLSPFGYSTYRGS